VDVPNNADPPDPPDDNENVDEHQQNEDDDDEEEDDEDNDGEVPTNHAKNMMATKNKNKPRQKSLLLYLRP
jgi:hypothetical protein